MGSLVELCLVLLIVGVALINGGYTAIASSSSAGGEAAREYWQKAFPGVELPQNLEEVLSPLSEPLLAHYKAVKQAGHLDEERAAFCEVARIACDAQEFEQFREKVPAAPIPWFGTLTPMPGYSQYVQTGDGKVVRKHGDFFREAKLSKGSHLPLGYEKEHIPQRAFLPAPLAALFASESVPHQLLELAIPPNSHLATEMGFTFGTCTMQPLKGEVKNCVASLEDMVDLVQTHINSNGSRSIEVLTVGGLNMRTSYSSPAFVQNQRIIMPSKDMSTYYGLLPATVVEVVERSGKDTKAMVCHTMMFTYAMYHCHSAGHERVYEVTLQAHDGAASKKTVLAMCHMDTSQWTPHHLAFYDLGVQPGETEACHWIHEGDVLFLANPAPPSSSAST